MNKSELILKLKEKLPLQDKLIKEGVDIFFNTISESLIEGKRVEFRDFGSFCLHEHSAKLAHNPQTGQKFYVAPKQVPYFKASKALKNKLNDDYR